MLFEHAQAAGIATDVGEQALFVVVADGGGGYSEHFGGVMSNPTVEKLREGATLAREQGVDFILAVGGGSVCDFAKAVSISAHCDEDPWKKFYLRFEDVDNAISPVGRILTMVGTGSEMNGGAVIADPEDYEARSDIMWTATWALNTLIAKGKSTDWMVHMIGQSIGGFTDATHGMTLSAVSLAYYRLIMPAGLPKFKRYAMNVWGVDAAGKTDEQVAEEGLARMEDWMSTLGLVMNVTELGVTDDMLEGIAAGTFILEGGYKVLTRNEVVDVLKASK